MGMAGADFWGDAVPNWIGATVGICTLAAAVAAGLWARSAARSTKSQADTAAKALIHAKAEAVAAREDSTFQRGEAVAASRRAEETRLDATFPSVVAYVTLGSGALNGGSPIDFAFWGDSGFQALEPLTGEVELKAEERAVFRTTLVMVFENLSDIPAQIDIVDPYGGEMPEFPPGKPLFLGARVKHAVLWERKTTSMSLSDDGAVDAEHVALFRLKFLVRDIGMRVQETFEFSGNMNHFRRDGSRLIASQDPSGEWPNPFAFPRKREYPGLQRAADEATGPVQSGASSR
jgi:hypothetical protein